MAVTHIFEIDNGHRVELRRSPGRDYWAMYDNVTYDYLGEAITSPAKDGSYIAFDARGMLIGSFTDLASIVRSLTGSGTSDMVWMDIDPPATPGTPATPPSFDPGPPPEQPPEPEHRCRCSHGPASHEPIITRMTALDGHTATFEGTLGPCADCPCLAYEEDS